MLTLSYSLCNHHVFTIHYYSSLVSSFVSLDDSWRCLGIYTELLQVEKLPSGFIPGTIRSRHVVKRYLLVVIGDLGLFFLSSKHEICTRGWGPDDLYYPSWMEGRCSAAKRIS